MARLRRSAVLCCRASIRQPLLSTRCQSSMRHLRQYQRKHSCACSTHVMGRVLSKNHSTGWASCGGPISLTCTTHSLMGGLLRCCAGGAQLDLTVAQRHLGAALKAVNLDQRQCAHLAGLGRHILRRRHRRIKAPGRLAFATARRCNTGQHRMAGLRQFAQRFGAACGLRVATRVNETKVPTRRLGKSGTTGMRAVGQ